MPPTHALTSPVIGSITIKAVCIICLWYFMESIGVITVSFSRCVFHAKIFIGTFLLNELRIACIAQSFFFHIIPAITVFHLRFQDICMFFPNLPVF